MSTSFPGIQRLRCPNCPASFRNDSGLYQHIKAKHALGWPSRSEIENAKRAGARAFPVRITEAGRKEDNNGK